ncbi:nucleoside triphosphate pyrophosphohydrolase [Vibrio sp. WXL103]|uniref:nucleoside triphosphate pyrophosphohydrolase n=1 Tax=unclassified Vibrio TaxID=2614977 RepID=UPI003EC6ABDE
MSHPIEQLEQIMSQLRDPKTGCPWDLKQSFDTIVPHTIEETYEVVDAIQNRDWSNLKEELGDLLFQVIFYSQLAKEQQLFDFAEVVETVNEKLTRRHPHVFSDVEFASEEEISANWEAEKAKEKAQVGKAGQSILDSIPKSLPAISRATKIQKQCAKVGFDWHSLGPVVEKVQEEIEEVMEEALQVSPDSDKVEMELGDLMFAVINLSRHLDTNPEVALGKANQKFVERFKGVEKLAEIQGKSLNEMTLDQMEALWVEVKAQRGGQ